MDKEHYALYMQNCKFHFYPKSKYTTNKPPIHPNFQKHHFC